MNYLIKIKKYSTMSYTSHNDLMRIFEYTLRRGECPFEFRGKFHPTPFFTFDSAMPLGYILKEYHIILKTKSEYDFGILNKYTPKGLKILDYKEVPDNYSFNNTISGYNMKIYLSENIFRYFYDTETIEKGQNTVKKEDIFNNLTFENISESIFMIKYYQARDYLYNFYKIVKLCNPSEKYTYVPICDSVVWR
ncbi:MAG: DUF2344 domain-containing protein [Thermotogae bacterium]|nr:DUF2344 domain-containing protein [Thermotogota bacterium]MCP5465711.1 DUF2344 domain-containing protein [Thermotogota bacterium]HOO75003.1 DUF2344 domain-containing protein [Tepiditoga sp.]